MSLASLVAHRSELLRHLALANDDMRRGSLEERFRRCGKPRCHCAARDTPGHGPVFVLTRKINGRTVSEIIPAEKVERIKAQLERWHHFQKLSKELIEVNEAICKMREGDVLKKTSKSISKPRSMRN